MLDDFAQFGELLWLREKERKKWSASSARTLAIIYPRLVNAEKAITWSFFLCVRSKFFFIRRCCCFSTQCAISSFHHLAFVPWTKNIFAHSACPYLCEASYSLLEIGVYVNWRAICLFLHYVFIIVPLYITRCYWCSRFRVRASNCIRNYGEKKKNHWEKKKKLWVAIEIMQSREKKRNEYSQIFIELRINGNVY